MSPIVTTHVLELIHMDLLTIEPPNSDKDINILVVVAVCILISPTDSLDLDQLIYHHMNMH